MKGKGYLLLYPRTNMSSASSTEVPNVYPHANKGVCGAINDKMWMTLPQGTQDWIWEFPDGERNIQMGEWMARRRQNKTDPSLTVRELLSLTRSSRQSLMQLEKRSSLVVKITDSNGEFDINFESVH